MAETQPICTISYEDRFGDLKPVNAAACIMFALDEMQRWDRSRGNAEIAQYNLDVMRAYRETDQHLASAVRSKNSFMTFVNATDSEEDALRYVGAGRMWNTQPFQDVLSNAVGSLLLRDQSYTYLLDVASRPDDFARSSTYRDGRMYDTYPAQFRSLSSTQQKFLKNWSKHYIGVPARR